MRTREEQYEEWRRYENDTAYEVWRSGGNPDKIDDDVVTDNYYNQVPLEDTVRSELHRQQPRPSFLIEEEEQQENDYWNDYWNV